MREIASDNSGEIEHFSAWAGAANIAVTLVGVCTRIRIWVKLTDREGGGEYLYLSWRWKHEVLSRPDKA